jgi:hypothetical protein
MWGDLLDQSLLSASPYHARRLACADPVHRAKTALEQEREIVVIVDNDIAAAMAGAGRLVVP